MARNGAGIYVLPGGNPVVSGTIIESNWANTTLSDVAAALTQSIAYDGQTTPIANLPMGSFRHLNVSDPTLRNQYATLGMTQDGRDMRVTITGGIDNLVGTLVGGAVGYSLGALVTFQAPATNSGPMTLNFNGIGTRSIITSDGLPLAAGDVVAGAVLLAQYDGAAFRLISTIQSDIDQDIFSLNTTGQERPPSGTFTLMTVASGTSINVPAGTAWIVPPGAISAADAEEVSWSAQAISLLYLATAFSTTIAVNDAGAIVQFPGRVFGANLRGYAVLGVVEHLTGVVNSVSTKPMIFADDLYRNSDIMAFLSNTVVSGGLVTVNASPLKLNISSGSILSAGGTPNTASNPNLYPINAQTALQFRTLLGQSTVGGALIDTAPVGSYDPNGAGVLTALPLATDATIHRLYFLYGVYIWVYGQRVYSSVENALSLIEVDRTRYVESLLLTDATLVAEIVATRTATDLGNLAQGAIVAPGGINFSIGSPGGIAEAPIDGLPYGRQDAGWTRVLSAATPTITGAAPVLTEVLSPVAASTSGFLLRSGAFNWFAMHTVNPDDKTYFRSYNPATGVLRSTPLTLDLANGRVGVNNTSPSLPLDVAGASLLNGACVVSGNFTISGNSRQIIGDWDNATIANRTSFVTLTGNAETNVMVRPNGTSTKAGVVACNNSVMTNASYLSMYANGVGAFLETGAFGAGTPLPLSFTVNGITSFGLSSLGNAQFNGTAGGNFVWDRSTSAISTGNNSAVNASLNIGKGIAGGGVLQEFRTMGTLVGTISCTGAATAYNTSSDYRLKEDIWPVASSGMFIDMLRPRIWKWKTDGSKGAGFIAHELAEVSPSSVTGAKDAVDAEGEPVYQQVSYGSGEIIANLVAEVQALRKRVAALESE